MELSRTLTTPPSPDLSCSHACQSSALVVDMDGMQKEAFRTSTQTIKRSRRAQQITCWIAGLGISGFVATHEVRSTAGRRSARMCLSSTSKKELDRVLFFKTFSDQTMTGPRCSVH